MSARISHPTWLVTPFEVPARQVLPSGQSVDLYEVLIDDVGAERWLRFRFIAPDIAGADGALTFTETQEGFEHLCAMFAGPYMEEFALDADVVVISLLDRPVEFGVSDPEATQLIEAFRITDAGCQWEGLW